MRAARQDEHGQHGQREHVRAASWARCDTGVDSVATPEQPSAYDALSALLGACDERSARDSLARLLAMQ